MTKVSLPSLLIILGIASGLRAQTPDDRPSFTEVVRTYFGKYDTDSFESEIRFQKKKEGWVLVYELDHQSQYFIFHQLFWSAKERKYLPVDCPLLTDKIAPAVVDDRIRQYHEMIGYDEEMLKDYDQYPYFGYKDWEQDVIHDFGEQSGLSDTLTDAVARAYRLYAADLFWSARGMPVSTPVRDSFIVYEKRSQEMYHRLLGLNPGYQSRVNNSAATEYANSRLFAYTELLYYGYPRHAKRFLRHVEYPDTVVDRVRQILAIPEKGSIVVTGGDNDFYVSTYLQTRRHYRRDLVVLSHSLLALPEYRSYLFEQYKANPLFSTSLAEVKRRNFDFAWRLQNSTDTISLAGFLSSIKLDPDSIRGFTSGNVLIPFPAKNGSVSSTLCLELPMYVLSPDFMLLDMYSTVADRSIYLTFRVNEGANPRDFIQFSSHLKTRGPLFFLSPD